VVVSGYDMSCLYPLWRKIPFRGDLVQVPCGRCRGCRLDNARDWALRCYHEAQMHDENSFLTLTYNDKNLPKDGSIHKSHLQKFIKRLRKAIEPKRLRYYACGEYGEKMGRPHYHAIIFGYDFPDKEFHHVSNPKKRNRFSTSDQNKVYTSGLLDSIWQKGYGTIGEVSFESAGYVARYIGKKIGGEMALEHYKGKNPEFALMSRRPGIGSKWLEKYFTDVYPKDFTTVNGRKMKPPRYYDKKLMKSHWDLHETIKEQRKEKIKHEDIIRRRQKEKYLKNVTQDLKRRLEHE
jgi:hypothetical protein